MSQYKLQILLIILIGFSVWDILQNKTDNTVDTKVLNITDKKVKIEPIKQELGGKNFQSVPDEKNIPEQKQVEVQVDLPSLEKSDGFFRQELVSVSVDLLDWFEADNLIKKYIVIINDLSQKQIIYKHRAFLAPAKKMQVAKDSRGLYLDENSYKRYDGLANAIATINIEKATKMYLRWKPLFEEVYQDFSYPAEYQLEDIFLKAAASVIEAPVIEGRIALVKHAIRYKFADKNLESASDVEKQMIRMGPENTRKVQSTLRGLVQALAILPE